MFLFLHQTALQRRAEKPRKCSGIWWRGLWELHWKLPLKFSFWLICIHLHFQLTAGFSLSEWVNDRFTRRNTPHVSLGRHGNVLQWASFCRTTSSFQQQAGLAENAECCRGVWGIMLWTTLKRNESIHKSRDGGVELYNNKQCSGTWMQAVQKREDFFTLTFLTCFLCNVTFDENVMITLSRRGPECSPAVDYQ